MARKPANPRDNWKGTSFAISEQLHERYNNIPRGVCIRDVFNQAVISTTPDQYTVKDFPHSTSCTLSPEARTKLSSIPPSCRASFLRKCMSEMLSSLGV